MGDGQHNPTAPPQPASQDGAPISYLWLAALLPVVAAWAWLNATLYQPTRSEITMGTAEKNPLFGQHPAPPRGETIIRQKLKDHVAHQLINFADPYAPNRPLEHFRQILYPSTGTQPQMDWLHWASAIAPHDFRTIRTEFFWVYQIKGPAEAAKVIRAGLQNDPGNSLLWLDLAYAEDLNPQRTHPPGQYTLAAFQRRNHWEEWEIKDLSTLAEIMLRETKAAKRRFQRGQPTQLNELAQALTLTLDQIKKQRAEEQLPQVDYHAAEQEVRALTPTTHPAQ